MAYAIRVMTLDDYEDVYRLWQRTEGMSLGPEDDREGIVIYLRRNPDLCFVAVHEQAIIGVVLCGHEGRRGILRHLAVDPACRRQGIATALIQHCLDGLLAQGISKCNIFVLDENPGGLAFWERRGFYYLNDDYRTLQQLTDQRIA